MGKHTDSERKRGKVKLLGATVSFSITCPNCKNENHYSGYPAKKTFRAKCGFCGAILEVTAPSA